MVNDVREMRDKLVKFLERDLVGPALGPEETLNELPNLRYSAGVLFPSTVRIDESQEIGGAAAPEDAAGDPLPPQQDIEEFSEGGDGIRLEGEASTDDGGHDDTVTLANSYKPSAIGLSFMCAEDCSGLVIHAEAATYEPVAVGPEQSSSGTRPSERGHRRRQLPIGEEKIPFLDRSFHVIDRELAAELHLRCVVRRRDSGRLVTVSLYNKATHIRGTKFYQCGFRVVGEQATPVFMEYGSGADGARDPEERALAMLYRKRRVFAVGHGCAPDWSPIEAERASVLTTSVLPSLEIPPILPTDGDEPYLNMEALGETLEESELLTELRRFCDDYSGWIEDRATEVANIDGDFAECANEHIRLCRLANRRMRQGVRVLEDNAHALEAFRRVNQAMVQQQYHVRRGRRLAHEPLEALPLKYHSTWSETVRVGFWRKFQVAFLLMNLPSFVPAESVLVEEDATEIDTRDLVDLIWFPTGGGKTEAYLGVAAFAIFMRRLERPASAGCTVLMRYTLRLLTSQQFQRAASLIAACELQRRAAPERLGDTPFTVGLWVGQSLTPNTEKAAKSAVRKLAKDDDDANNPFQLLTCPWCGTQLDHPDALGYRISGGRQVFVCPASGAAGDSSSSCPFSADGAGLPVCVVDESLYRDPATLIIGTVDKFAMLAWREEAGALLGADGANEPPDLIIQDELHLISGPLGSMVGLYEGLIDYICVNPRTGRRAKIVASTATIRRAEAQCRHLYDRSMFQFPPQGLDISDSFFAEEQADRAGRIYVGFLPTAASSPLTAQVRVVSALTQAPLIECDDLARSDLIDPYWTLLQYFSSLKELGRAATLVTQDIPEFLGNMQRRYGLPKERIRWLDRAEELTSRKREDEIPKILERMERRFEPGAVFGAQALDTVLATNMISVGMDVDRLGLMLVVTQPKSTSEYIQATSRVGRSSSAPGLVLTLYNASRPRDRSHYERFRGYHAAFYQFVEPTSVTPFALSAMDRALHALLIIAGRHVAHMQSPTDFAPERTALLDKAMSFLEDRAKSIDADHLEDFLALLKKRRTEWSECAAEEWGGFSTPEKQTLIYPAGNTPHEVFGDDSWPTPTSLRNVDVECVGAPRMYPRLETSDG